jgi:hypothetical protein
MQPATKPTPIVRDRLIDLKQELLRSAANCGRQPRFNPNLFYMTVGKLDEHIGEEKRHAFFEAVFGRAHSKDLTDAQKFAILLWAKPAAVDNHTLPRNDGKAVWTYDRQFRRDVHILVHARIQKESQNA